MAQWIWRFGEFETYHNSVVHSRRQAYGYHEPPVWKIYRPEPVVEFRKKNQYRRRQDLYPGMRKFFRSAAGCGK